MKCPHRSVRTLEAGKTMLTIEQTGKMVSGVNRQYELTYSHKDLQYPVSIKLNTWEAGCCGFNTLAGCSSVGSLSQPFFDDFMSELSRIFKDKDYKFFFENQMSPPYYPIHQVFFLYGDVFHQREALSKFLAIGKEVHRYVSGSEPGHDTVMISIDL